MVALSFLAFSDGGLVLSLVVVDCFPLCVLAHLSIGGMVPRASICFSIVFLCVSIYL